MFDGAGRGLGGSEALVSAECGNADAASRKRRTARDDERDEMLNLNCIHKIPPERLRAHRSRRRVGAGSSRSASNVSLRCVRTCGARTIEHRNADKFTAKIDPAREVARIARGVARGGIFAFRVERVASVCAHVRCSIESRADKKRRWRTTRDRGKRSHPERLRAHRSRRREGRNLRVRRRTCRFDVCARAVLDRERRTCGQEAAPQANHRVLFHVRRDERCTHYADSAPPLRVGASHASPFFAFEVLRQFDVESLPAARRPLATISAAARL